MLGCATSTHYTMHAWVRCTNTLHTACLGPSMHCRVAQFMLECCTIAYRSSLARAFVQGMAIVLGCIYATYCTCIGLFSRQNSSASLTCCWILHFRDCRGCFEDPVTSFKCSATSRLVSSPGSLCTAGPERRHLCLCPALDQGRQPSCQSSCASSSCYAC